MIKEGTWSLWSKSDSRWNASGRGMISVFEVHPDAVQKVKDLKQQFGEPPDDLEYSCMKD